MNYVEFRNTRHVEHPNESVFVTLRAWKVHKQDACDGPLTNLELLKILENEFRSLEEERTSTIRMAASKDGGKTATIVVCVRENKGYNPNPEVIVNKYTLSVGQNAGYEVRIAKQTQTLSLIDAMTVVRTWFRPLFVNSIVNQTLSLAAYKSRSGCLQENALKHVGDEMLSQLSDIIDSDAKEWLVSEEVMLLKAETRVRLMIYLWTRLALDVEGTKRSIIDTRDQFRTIYTQQLHGSF